jgi:hypothetical protein
MLALVGFIFWRTIRLIVVVSAALVMFAAGAISAAFMGIAWPFMRLQGAIVKHLQGLTSPTPPASR